MEAFLLRIIPMERGMFLGEFQKWFCRFMLEGTSVDYPIVHVDGKVPASHVWSEDRVHHRLERGRGVCKPKEHNEGFEQSFWGQKRRFPFIALFDADVIVP